MTMTMMTMTITTRPVDGADVGAAGQKAMTSTRPMWGQDGNDHKNTSSEDAVRRVAARRRVLVARKRRGERAGEEKEEEKEGKGEIKNVTKYLTCVLSLYAVLHYRSISGTFCVISVW